MEYCSDSIAISSDMGPLSACEIWAIDPIQMKKTKRACSLNNLLVGTGEEACRIREAGDEELRKEDVATSDLGQSAKTSIAIACSEHPFHTNQGG